jgi:hypothetical protein
MYCRILKNLKIDGRLLVKCILERMGFKDLYIGFNGPGEHM